MPILSASPIAPAAPASLPAGASPPDGAGEDRSFATLVRTAAQDSPGTDGEAEAASPAPDPAPLAGDTGMAAALAMPFLLQPAPEQVPGSGLPKATSAAVAAGAGLPPGAVAAAPTPPPADPAASPADLVLGAAPAHQAAGDGLSGGGRAPVPDTGLAAANPGSVAARPSGDRPPAGMALPHPEANGLQPEGQPPPAPALLDPTPAAADGPPAAMPGQPAGDHGPKAEMTAKAGPAATAEPNLLSGSPAEAATGLVASDPFDPVHARGAESYSRQVPRAALVEQIVPRIAQAVSAGRQVVSVHLHPLELGSVQIRIEVDPDRQVRAVVHVLQPETLELLQRHAPGIERALTGSGLTLAGSDGLTFDLGESGDGPGQGGGEQHRPPPARPQADPPADAAAARPDRPAARAGLLDLVL